MAKVQWSYYEEREAMKFVQDRIDWFANGLDSSECKSAAWTAYFEVRQKYEKDLSNTDFWVHAGKKIKENIDEIRKVRNDKITFESPFSLNKRVGENQEEVLTFLPSKQGDFTNNIHFWLYVKNLGKLKFNIIELLTQQEDDYDIMTKLRISREEYYRQKIEIRKIFSEYSQEIDN